MTLKSTETRQEQYNTVSLKQSLKNSSMTFDFFNDLNC